MKKICLSVFLAFMLSLVLITIVRAQDWLTSIDGRRYTCPIYAGVTEVIDVRGKVIVRGEIMTDGKYVEVRRIEIEGRTTTIENTSKTEIKIPKTGNTPGWNKYNINSVEDVYIINVEDNNITEYSKYDNGDIIQHVFQWER